jgi:hypothetical protein
VQDIDDLASGLAAHVGGSLFSRHFELLENGDRNGTVRAALICCLPDFCGLGERRGGRLLLRVPESPWRRRRQVRSDMPLAEGCRPPFMSPRSIWVLLTVMMRQDLVI